MSDRLELRELGLAAVALFAVTGIAIAMGWYTPVVALLVPVLIAGLVFTPAARPVILLLAASSFVFVWAAPSVAVGSINVYLGEGLLFVVCAATAFDMLREGSPRGLFRDPVSPFVALFGVAALVGVVIGFSQGTAFSDVFGGFRPMVFAFAFVVVRFALARPVWRRGFLIATSVVAVLLAAAQAIQVATGSAVNLFVVGDFSDLIAQDPATGFLRVRPPGLYLEYAVACMAAVYVIWGPKRGRVWALVVLASTLGGIFLSFNRNMLVGFVIALVVAATFSTRRSRFLTVAVVLVLLAFLGFVYLGGPTSSNPVVQRFVSLTDPNARAVALADRNYETGLAFLAASRSPIVGIGWGTPYGASATRVFEDIVASRQRDWVHNQYLASWLRMGLLGAIAFIGIIGATIFSSIRASRFEGDEELTWLAPACLAAMTAFAVSSAVDLVMLSPSNLPVFVTIAAIGSFLWARRRELSGEAAQ